MSTLDEQAAQLAAAIASLEAQRETLGDSVVEPAVAALRQKLAQLETTSDDSGAGEERKIVTILFADVSGFTALSEQKDPEEVRSLINGCFEHLVPVVQKFGGTIDKFIGDEIMALFGAPVAHEDDPERAVRTALELMEAMTSFNQAHGTDLNLHIGINTGAVIAGNIGSTGRRDYSVMGDAVNLAARLEDASPDGETFVGPRTYAQTSGVFEYEKIPPLKLKGKSTPVDIYRLGGLRPRANRTRGIEGLHASLVGRDAELAQMHSALAAVQNGFGGILSIVGEAGLGKSRLLAEARASVEDNLTWAEGRALSYTSGMSYWLARALLHALLKVKAETPPADIEKALRESLAQNAPDNVERIYPFLGRVLEVPMAAAMEEQVNSLPAEAVQRRIREAFRLYVGARAKGRPLALVWEDLHWCDPSSLQVFETLLPLTNKVPLLLLGVSRPDEERATELLDKARQAFPAAYEGIKLSPLTREQSQSLVSQLLEVEDLPVTLRDLIFARAEGNPFFLEELLRSLLDTELLVRNGNAVSLAREIRTVDIPETVQGVLTARIDRLKTRDKTTLQKASVIGRTFQQPILVRLYEPSSGQERRIGASLSELQRREFIQSRQSEAEAAILPPEEEFTFKHAITHDVAYQSMLMARRKELHQLAGQAIETLFPDRREELAATLAYHFERAEAPEQAAFYLGRAAERARATFANSEAMEFYRSAIRQIESVLVTKQDETTCAVGGRLHEGLGDVLKLIGKNVEARSHYESAESIVPPREQVWHSRLRRKAGLTHAAEHHYDLAGDRLQRAEQCLGSTKDSATNEWWNEYVQIQMERLFLYYWQGMAAEMTDLASRIRPIVEKKGSPDQRGNFFKMLALSHLSRSRYAPSPEGVQLAQLAVSMSEGLKDLSEESHIRFVLGFAHLWNRDFADAIKHFQAASRLAEKVGDLVIQTRGLTYLCVAHRCAHEVDETKSVAQRALEMATELEMVEYVAMAKANLAWAAWSERRLTDGEAEAKEALQLWHAMEDPYGFDWMALWPLIAIKADRNEMGEAVEAARALFGPNQHPLPEELTKIVREAITAWEKNEVDTARARLAAAMEMAGELGQL